MGRRLLLAALLAAGVVWGYGTAAHELASAVHGGGGHCHRSEQAAPSE